MSAVLEKTFSASLPKILTEHLLGTQPNVQKPQSTSRAYQNFVRYVTESRSKSAERYYVQKELAHIEVTLSQPHSSNGQIKDCMLRAVYCGIMGYNVSFAHIHAVKLAQSSCLSLKRIGYLASSVLLHESHELSLLLINTIIKDIQSSNVACVYMGLIAACDLVSIDMIPTVLPAILSALKNQRDIIRKKAAGCLYKFYTVAPDLIDGVEGNLRAALRDKDPGVMAATLPTYYLLIQKDPEKYLSLMSGFCITLSQIINNKLSSDYMYHSVPAPWTQILLIRILTLLAKQSTQAATQLFPLLKEVLQRVSSKENIAFAILYECVVSLTTVCSQPELLETAAGCVGNFLKSTNNNFRYIGLEALEKLLAVSPRLATDQQLKDNTTKTCMRLEALEKLLAASPRLAADQQLKVVECLTDPDPSIQRKTYTILCGLTTSANIVVIYEKLTEYICTQQDGYTRTELLGKLAHLVKQYAPDDCWYMKTMLDLVRLSGDNFSDTTIVNQFYTSAKHISDEDVKVSLIKESNKYLSEDTLPNCLLQITAWRVGEYTTSTDEKTLQTFLRHFKSPHTSSTSQNYIIGALLKLVLTTVILSVEVEVIGEDLLSCAKGNDVKQRIQELSQVCQLLTLKDTRLKPLQHSQDCEADMSLSFLDEYICESIERGEPVYIPRHLRDLPQKDNVQFIDQIHPNSDAGFIAIPTTQATESVVSSSSNRPGLPSSTTSSDLGACVLKMDNVKRVWDKSGLRSFGDEITKGDNHEKTEQNDLAKALFGD